MVALWLVVAALLYVPFKRWVATSEAPMISALLWPLLIGFFTIFIISTPLIALFKIITGKQL